MKYIKETLKKYQEKYGGVKKENIPLATTANPELEDSKVFVTLSTYNWYRTMAYCRRTF
jgi:hypothetical protein